jgi:hypothetical protein
MQNDAVECIYSVTVLTRKNMFRSCIGQPRQDPLAIGNDHTRFPFGPRLAPEARQRISASSAVWSDRWGIHNDLTLLAPAQDFIQILPGIEQTVEILVASWELGKATVVVGDEAG